MRVTKRIEEYISRTINNKAQSKIDEIWEPSHKEQEQIREQLKVILDEANRKAEELLAQHPQYTMKNRYGINAAFYSNDYLGFKPGYDRELAEETDRIRKASRAAVENIVLELELGGDKAMLEKMLNEVNF